MAWYVGKWIEKVFDKTFIINKGFLLIGALTKDNQYFICNHNARGSGYSEGGDIYKIDGSNLKAITNNNFESGSEDNLICYPVSLKVYSDNTYISFSNIGYFYNFDRWFGQVITSVTELGGTHVNSGYSQLPTGILYFQESKGAKGVRMLYNSDYGIEFQLITIYENLSGNIIERIYLMDTDSINLVGDKAFLFSFNKTHYGIIYNSSLCIISTNSNLNSVNNVQTKTLYGSSLNKFPLTCFVWNSQTYTETRLIYQIDDGGSDSLDLYVLYWENIDSEYTNETNLYQNIKSVIGVQEIKQFYANNTFSKIIITSYNQQEEDYGAEQLVDNIYYFCKNSQGEWIQCNKYHSQIDPYSVIDEMKKENTTTRGRLGVLSPIGDFNLLTVTVFNSSNIQMSSFDYCWND